MRSYKSEAQYQSDLVEKIKRMFEDCVVLVKPGFNVQGFPDILILFGNTWAVLEVKATRCSAVQPNQNWYVDNLGHMSFAAFIYPENEEEVLSELQRSFQSGRTARVSQR